MPIYAKSAKDGKPKELLSAHTINDIRVGRQLVANLPFHGEEKKRIGTILDTVLALHDLGKGASGFQASLEEDAERWGKRHEVISAVLATSLGFSDDIVFLVITHHKTLLPNTVTFGSSCLTDEELPYRDHIYKTWKNMRKEWYENLTEIIEEWSKICEFLHIDNLNLNPTCLDTLLSDTVMKWLDRHDQKNHLSFEQIEKLSVARGLVISADHIASACHNAPVEIPELHDYKKNITPEKPHTYQLRAGKHLGNLILSSPTGSGKTEAALLWACRNQKENGRLFYTLPITASLNAMWLRLGDEKKFNDQDHKLVGLLHSRIASSIYSMLEQDNKFERQKKSWDLRSLAREMYFPIRVCTPHQVMKFTLFGKGWEMMLSEFPNSVFIFDEVHAYNPRHTALTMATAKYIVSKGGSVMFLSATLPKFLRRIIKHEIPGIKFMRPSMKNESDRRILEQKRHILLRKEGDVISNIDFIISEANKAKSTLVVCNHVPTAQRVYKEISKNIQDTILIHGQFTRMDRSVIEDRLQDSLPKVLVSTQVVEVSLDIDFEQGFTEPAPIDAVIQRFGRINRRVISTKRPPAKVRIFTEQYSDDEHVYTKKLRDKSLEVLSDLENPLSEAALIKAADKVYGKGYDEKQQDEYDKAYQCIQVQKDMLAASNREWVEYILDDDEGSIEVLPEVLLDKFNEKKEQKLTIEAFGLCVPVGKWRLRQLSEEGRIVKEHDAWILRGCKYDSKIGLEILPKNSRL